MSPTTKMNRNRTRGITLPVLLLLDTDPLCRTYNLIDAMGALNKFSLSNANKEQLA